MRGKAVITLSDLRLWTGQSVPPLHHPGHPILRGRIVFGGGASPPQQRLRIVGQEAARREVARVIVNPEASEIIPSEVEFSYVGARICRALRPFDGSTRILRHSLPVE